MDWDLQREPSDGSALFHLRFPGEPRLILQCQSCIRFESEADWSVLCRYDGLLSRTWCPISRGFEHRGLHCALRPKTWLSATTRGCMYEFKILTATR
jgi:hypothetical protein